MTHIGFPNAEITRASRTSALPPRTWEARKYAQCNIVSSHNEISIVQNSFGPNLISHFQGMWQIPFPSSTLTKFARITTTPFWYPEFAQRKRFLTDFWLVFLLFLTRYEHVMTVGWSEKEGGEEKRRNRACNLPWLSVDCLRGKKERGEYMWEEYVLPPS